MIKTKKDLGFYNQEDMKRSGIGSYSMYIVRLLCKCEDACALHYIRCMRSGEYHLNNSSNLFHKAMSIFYKVRLSRLGRKYSISIPMNTCGYGLRLMHLSGGGGILLNIQQAGNYCGFNAGVLLGNSDGQENRPVIGDHVSFGPGAKAFGKITIGNNVFVAPNAVVVKDLPDNCIAGGVPAKIIKYKD